MQVTTGPLTRKDAAQINQALAKVETHADVIQRFGNRTDPDTDPFVAAQITGYDPVSGTHAWKRQIWNPADNTRIDDPLGLTGDSTWLPAYSLNGEVVATGTNVWLKASTQGPQSQAYEIMQTAGGSGMTLVGVVSQIATLSGSPGNYTGTLAIALGLPAGKYMFWGRALYQAAFGTFVTNVQIDMQADPVFTGTSSALTPPGYEVSQVQSYGSGGGGVLADTIGLSVYLDATTSGNFGIGYVYAYNTSFSGATVNLDGTLWQVG